MLALGLLQIFDGRQQRFLHRFCSKLFKVHPWVGVCALRACVRVCVLVKRYLLSRAKEVVKRSDAIPRKYHGRVERAAQRLCREGQHTVEYAERLTRGRKWCTFAGTVCVVCVSCVCRVCVSCDVTHSDS
jgi:hypothetical protein